MRRRLLALVLSAVAGAAFADAPAQRRVAVTVDDLPWVGPSPAEAAAGIPFVDADLSLFAPPDSTNGLWLELRESPQTYLFQNK